MKITIIIINYKTAEMTAAAVRGVLAGAGGGYEIVLIDNHSEDGSTLCLKNEFGNDLRVRLITNNENLGFAKAVNQGAKLSTAEYLFLLNSDAKTEGKEIEKLIKFMDSNREAAVAGARMVDSTGKPQISFGHFPTLLKEIFFNLYRIFPYFRIVKYNRFSEKLFRAAHEADWVSGGAMILRRDAFELLGGFDDNYFMYIEDIDLCFRARQAGLKVYYFPEAQVQHKNKGEASLQAKIMNYNNLIYFFKKFYNKRKLYVNLAVGFLNLKLHLIKRIK